VKRLAHRVRNVGTTHARAMAGYSQVTGSQASPGGTPDVMPLAQVLVYPAPGGTYSTIAYQGLAPIYVAGPNRRPVPASSPGRWGQYVAAGRP
jgi:hypothetical protein